MTDKIDPKSQWYVARNNTPVGPMSFAALKQEASAGTLSPHDLIWMSGAPAWVAAGSVADLFSAQQVRSTPPPVPTNIASNMPPTMQYASHRPPPPSDIGANAGMRMLLPVGRSGWAIAAGYAGLLSVLLIFAPLAVIFGILAIREMRRDPNKHGMGRAVFGIIMGSIFSIALVAVVFLAMTSR